jgi:hypothetical protein
LVSSASSAIRIGACRQAVSTSAKTRTLLAPRTRPANSGTITTTVDGSRATLPSSGLPYTGEMHISVRADVDLRDRAAEQRSRHREPLADRNAPSMLPGGVGREKECVMHATPCLGDDARRPGQADMCVVQQQLRLVPLTSAISRSTQRRLSSSSACRRLSCAARARRPTRQTLEGGALSP